MSNLTQSTNTRSNPYSPSLSGLYTIGLFLLFTILHSQAGAQDILNQCWESHFSSIGDNHIKFDYTESKIELHHSFTPWQKTLYKGEGEIWYNNSDFLKQDSLMGERRDYASLTEFRNEELLFQDYGDEELYPVDIEMLEEFPLTVARYTPLFILKSLLKTEAANESKVEEEYIIVTKEISASIVSVKIRRSDARLEEINVLSNHELFGDVLTSYRYSVYQEKEGVLIPMNIAIERINGKLKEEVRISSVSIQNSSPTLIEHPEHYTLTEKEIEEASWSVEERFEGIHFLEMYHTDDRVMLVEFEDYFLVAEAPVNSFNGELIISEVRKIAHDKPIKYFAFGHWHQHYIGGIRPFVADGAEILCSDANEEYMRYIVEAERTLVPDRLEAEPRELKTKLIRDSLCLSDDSMDMTIYFIGEKSAHTNDYLIYYFPAYKMLFQDDLVWIKEEGEPKRAGKRQAGLYQAIEELGLDVDLVLQSWPVSGYGVKTEIPYEDLERSMEVR